MCLSRRWALGALARAPRRGPATRPCPQWAPDAPRPRRIAVNPPPPLKRALPHPTIASLRASRRRPYAYPLSPAPRPPPDELVLDDKKIFKRYYYGMFWPDLLATVPFEAFAGSSAGNAS